MRESDGWVMVNLARDKFQSASKRHAEEGGQNLLKKKQYVLLSQPVTM